MALRLLVADDNASMQKMIRLAFAGEDVVIEAVSTGDAALDILQEFRPDMVLADVSMPGYSGYEVCELIRQDPEFAAIPVILLDGAFDPFDEEEAARVEASGHLTKPFDPSEMIAMMESLLRESAFRQQTDIPADEEDEAGTGTAAEIPEPFPVEPAESGAAASTGSPDAEIRGDDSGKRSEPIAKPPEAQASRLQGTEKCGHTPAFPAKPEGFAIGSSESRNPAPEMPNCFFYINQNVWESYLGPNRILEILPGGTLNVKTAVDWRIPEELADRIAEKVVEKMFPDIEALIRQTLTVRD